jgi:uncharacterized protein (DUF1015 family)
MKDYLKSGVFAPPLTGMVYIERVTSYGRTRAGLVTSIDLDAYEWKPGSTALIRATEATVPSRLPPRMEIRRGAPLELPHVMLLVNDAEKALVEGAGARAKKAAPLYDTDLMLDGGHITGWAVTGEALDGVREAASRVAAKNTQDGKVFMFAVGDGNHSLASAKAVWEEYKAAHKGEDLENHPARFALAEIVNIYDKGLTFEPIHRVLFGLKDGAAKEVAALLEKSLAGQGSKVSLEGNLITVATPNPTPQTPLAIVTVQPLLDEYLAATPGTSIDYIHGAEEVQRLAKQAGTVAILLPPIAKESFFSTIGARGALPRKTFSMGEASEKRYYFESRALY